MIEIDSKLIRAATLAAVAYTCAGAAGSALAQAPATPVGASMVQPPQAPASATNAK